MDATEIYSSQWLKAADIKEKKVKVTVAEVKPVVVKDNEPRKLELHFSELQKSLLLNKTNGTRMMEAFGKETDNWAGKTIELYTIMTNYQGEEVPAIRLKALKE